MPPPRSTLRLAALCAFLLAGLGAFAGTSSGSSAGALRAATPKLIAHDTSSFFPGRRPFASAPSRHVRTVRRSLFSTVPSLLHDFSAPKELVGIAPSGVFMTGDIGRTQYLQALGANYAIYSRAGGFLASVPDTAFWAGLGGSDAAGLCATSPSGEPAIAYDRAADRWVVAESAGGSGTFVQCLAVSTTGNAAGTWSRYVFQVSTRVHPDMLSLGVWPDGYYLSFNQLTTTSWAGAGALVVDRQAMLAHPGTEPKARYFDLGSVSPGLGGMRVATQESVADPDAGAPALYAQVYDDPLDNYDRVELWGFHVDWSAPASGSTFTRLATISQPDFPAFTTAAAGVAHTDPNATPPRSYTLPQLGGQLEYFRDGSGTQTLTLADTVNAGGSTVGWYQLQNAGAGWNVANSGTFGSPTGYAPAAAFDGGDVALGFPASDTSGPAPGYTDATDGTVGTRTVSGSPGGRSMALTLDPLVACTFWLTGSSVAAFSFAPCGTAAFSSAPVLTGDPTWKPGLVQETHATTVAVSGGFSGASTVQDQWLLCDLNGLNCVPIGGATGKTYVPTADDANGQHTLRFSDTATNAAGSSTAISSPAAVIESLPPANTTAPSVSGAAQVGGTLTALDGAWTSSSPISYTYRWQRCTGGTCINIAGASSSTYVVDSADLGSTIDAIVSATNTGGGVDARSAETAAVVVAPPGSTTAATSTTTTTTTGTTTAASSETPDLKLTATTANSTASVGEQATVFYTVADKNAKLARSTRVTLTLPPGLSYAGSFTAGTQACHVSGAQVICSLGDLSAASPSANVEVYLSVRSTGVQAVVATASSADGELSSSDNTATVAIGAGFSLAGPAAPAAILTANGVPLGLNGAPTSQSKPGADRVAPTTRALSSSGRRGKTAVLKFRIYDNSGVAKALATVTRRGKVVGRISTGFGPVAYGGVYYVSWRVPPKLAPGTYTFTVVAADRARHKSKPSRATLTVRR